MNVKNINDEEWNDIFWLYQSTKTGNVAILLTPRTLRFITPIDTSENEANEQKEGSYWVDLNLKDRANVLYFLIYNNSDVSADAADIDKHL